MPVPVGSGLRVGYGGALADNGSEALHEVDTVVEGDNEDVKLTDAVQLSVVEGDSVTETVAVDDADSDADSDGDADNDCDCVALVVKLSDGVTDGLVPNEAETVGVPLWEGVSVAVGLNEAVNDAERLYDAVMLDVRETDPDALVVPDVLAEQVGVAAAEGVIVAV